MKPWEIERTKNRMKLLSGQQTVVLFFDLYQAAWEMMRASILADRPRLSKAKLKQEVNRLADSVGRL